MGQVISIKEYLEKKEIREQKETADYIRKVLKDHYYIDVDDTDFLIYNSSMIDDELIQVTIEKDYDGEDNL